MNDVKSGPEGLRRHIRGKRSHLVWQDEREWGDVPSETYLDFLALHRDRQGDTIFVDFEGLTLSYTEYDLQSNRMANALDKLGVERGKTVVTLMDNSADLVLLACAIHKLGAIWVPVNTAYRGEFLRHQVADAMAELAICDNDYLENLLAIAPDVPELREIAVRNGPVPSHGNLRMHSMEALRGDDDSRPDVAVQPDDIACLIYTSGTTGPSKGCMISHAYLCSVGRRRNRSVAPWPGSVTWSPLPLFHIGFAVLIVANMIAGERLAMARRFSVSGFWDEIERSGATSVMMLATMLPLIAHASDTPAMLRCRGQIEVLTGVPLSEADRRIWQERFGVRYVNTYAYGQTEANLATLLPYGDPIPPPGSMGPPSEDFDVMVMGEDRRPVAFDEVGELLVRPRQPGAMFAGFWRRPQETLKAMTDLWWHTGDFVRMDANGYLYFVDRKKDYLRSRGENISSFEVESALMKNGALAEVVLHTVPGSVAGVEEDVKATAILRPDSAISEQALFEWAQANLPFFAVPRFIEFRDTLPKTPTGRVQKAELRAEGVTPRTWDATAAGYSLGRKKVSERA